MKGDNMLNIQTLVTGCQIDINFDPDTQILTAKKEDPLFIKAKLEFWKILQDMKDRFVKTSQKFFQTLSEKLSEFVKKHKQQIGLYTKPFFGNKARVVVSPTGIEVIPV